MKKIIRVFIMMVAVIGIRVGIGDVNAASINDTMENARSIKLNESYSDDATTIDSHYYKFTLSANGYVNVNLKHINTSNKSNQWKIRIYTSSSEELLYMDSYGTEIDKTSCNLGLESGIYYLKIEKDDWNRHSDYNYTFVVSFVSTKNWESEKNNEMLQADNIATNITYYGAIQDGPESDDWYKFNISKSGYVSINFKHINTTTSNNQWKIWVYTETTDELLYMDSAGTNIDKTSCNLGLTTGNYYVKIAKDGWYATSHEDYSFVVNYNESNNWEVELNNEIIGANQIALNNTYYGAIQSGPESDDWYKIDVQNDGYVSIDFNHESNTVNNNQWKIWLYTDSSEELLYITSNGNEIEKTSCNVGLANGVYYIKISKDGWYKTSHIDYSFAVNYKKSGYWEKELNNDMQSANQIAINNRYHGAIQSGPESDDYYLFSIDKGKNVTVNFKHKNNTVTNNQWDIKLYTAESEELLFLESSGNKKSVTSGKVYLDKGIYYIKISKDGWYDASHIDYSFSVSDKIHVKRPVKVSNVSGKGKKKAITISWNKMLGTKYVVAYAKNKSKLAKIKNYSVKTVKGTKCIATKKNKLTIKKLKKNKTYYYKVCAYITVDGKKVYGKWSKIKKIKTK